MNFLMGIIINLIDFFCLFLFFKSGWVLNSSILVPKCLSQKENNYDIVNKDEWVDKHQLFEHEIVSAVIPVCLLFFVYVCLFIDCTC